MAPNSQQYFIAIVPSSPVYDEALALKNLFKDSFQSKAALKSPPHITVHMPFEWKVAKEGLLIGSFEKLSTGLSPVSVALDGFGCFSPRVIFINVVLSEELKSLQKEVKRFCKQELNLFNADYKDIPYHPHLTVAFRDLKKPMFVKAWEEFRSREFRGEFLADRFSLLKHDGKAWNVLHDFQFGT